MSRPAPPQIEHPRCESNDVLAQELGYADGMKVEACMGEAVVHVGAQIAAEEVKQRQAVQTGHNSPAVAPSPLLSLPPELRNRIYELALVEPYALEASFGYAHVESATFKTVCFKSEDAMKNAVPEPGLTRTCKQIRTETLSLFYAKNTFALWRLPLHRRLSVTLHCEAPCAFSHLCHAARWLENIGAANREAMGRLIMPAHCGWVPLHATCKAEEKNLRAHFGRADGVRRACRMELKWKWNGEVGMPEKCLKGVLDPKKHKCFEILIEG